MSESLDEYTSFIDSLVGRKESIGARGARNGMWHEEPSPSQAKYNELFTKLSQEHCEVIAELLQHEREIAIHDVLAFLTYGGYHLFRDGVELAWEPFGTEMHYDFIARAAGDEWPAQKEST
jgi:hypothetical protein